MDLAYHHTGNIKPSHCSRYQPIFANQNSLTIKFQEMLIKTKGVQIYRSEYTTLLKLIVRCFR